MIEKVYNHLTTRYNLDTIGYLTSMDKKKVIQNEYYDLQKILGLLPEVEFASQTTLSDITFVYKHISNLLLSLDDIDEVALSFSNFSALATYIKIQSLGCIPAKRQEEEVKVSRHDMIDHVINLFYMADDFTDSKMAMEKVYRPYYDMFDDVEPYVRGAMAGGMSMHKAFKFFIVEIVFNYFYSMRDKHINLLMRCDDNLILMSTLALVVDTIEEDGNGI